MLINFVPEIPSLTDCKINDSDEDEDAWEEMEEQKEVTKCLFCENNEESVELAIDHLKSKHKFDLSQMKTKFAMDQYSFLKMINYIRFEKICSPDIFHSAETIFWDDEKYLKPLKYESWLTYDYETISYQESAESEINYAKIIEELSSQLKQKDGMLEQYAADVETMKISYKRLLDKEYNTVKKEESPRPTCLENSVGSVPLIDDEGYFSSYSHFGIHHSMLSVRIFQ